MSQFFKFIGIKSTIDFIQLIKLDVAGSSVFKILTEIGVNKAITTALVNFITIKGTTTIIFENKKNARKFIDLEAIKSNSIITTNIEIDSDEILIEDFQIITKNNIGLGFTIFCNPKIGKYTGTVTIKYFIS